MNYNGKKVKIMGGFNIESLGKEYALCSYEDETNNEEGFVIICEMQRFEGLTNLISIPKEEEDLVLMAYKSFKQEVLKEN